MHGVKRAKGTEEEEKAKKIALEKKIKKYKLLLELGNQKRKTKEYDQEGLKFTSDLLSVNGDCYSMWNYRRLCLLDMFNKKEQNNNEEDSEIEEKNKLKIKLLNQELNFTQQILKRNPKSYWVWNQREWVTQQLHNVDLCDWDNELRLCGLMLNADQRNFHCWNYRRYVTRYCSSLEQELEFTQTKIEQNFSNYSAWHQRSILLPQIYKDDNEGYLAAIDEELELVQNAFYTEPADQSAWFYHRWLVNQNPTGEIINNELEKCFELLEMLEEDDDVEEKVLKWPMLTIVFLYKQLNDLNNIEHREIIQKNLLKLIEIDPYHKEYYKNLMNNVSE
eukprot:TRINITY_DN3337_c4_g1_i1.p1 TRINITY_DN3337_c4_g1~~TRINITY_DN3337_c4_g1_i1.p1  ORF type:complete len:334 (-),score=102.60 TRINITY_DN3337_c4_g1_i1:142-1143(-)